jgi:anti-sigma factor RsiW
LVLSPLYVAAIESLPTGSADVIHVAVPEASVVALVPLSAHVSDPTWSLQATVPVGVPL